MTYSNFYLKQVGSYWMTTGILDFLSFIVLRAEMIVYSAALNPLPQSLLALQSTCTILNMVKCGHYTHGGLVCYLEASQKYFRYRLPTLR